MRYGGGWSQVTEQGAGSGRSPAAPGVRLPHRLRPLPPPRSHRSVTRYLLGSWRPASYLHAMQDSELKTWLHHYQDESDAAFLYSVLAGVEPDPKKRSTYEKLAAVERR